MKKALSSILAVIMIAALLIPAAATETSPEIDLYTPAADGDLLYTVNFTGDSMYEPGRSVFADADVEVTLDQLDTGKVTLKGLTDKAQGRWGAEVKGLPLNEKTAYTLYYTVTRSSTINEKDPALGIAVDDVFGFYGYSYNTRFLEKGKTLAGHNTIKYVDSGIAAEGDTYSTGESVQHYALEVNGQKVTMKLFVMDNTGAWVLADETKEGEVLVFYTDNIGVFFYVYYINMAVTISDVTIHKGMNISKEKLLEVVETDPPATTKTPKTEAPVTTSAPETDAPTEAGDVTTAAPVVTTAAPAKEEGGCKSFAAPSAIVFAIATGAIMIGKKKRR